MKVIADMKKEGRMSVMPKGRSDSASAPKMEVQAAAGLDGINDLTLDLTDLTYMSGGGLIVVLACQKS